MRDATLVSTRRGVLRSVRACEPQAAGPCDGAPVGLAREEGGLISERGTGDTLKRDAVTVATRVLNDDDNDDSCVLSVRLADGAVAVTAEDGRRRMRAARLQVARVRALEELVVSYHARDASRDDPTEELSRHRLEQAFLLRDLDCDPESDAASDDHLGSRQELHDATTRHDPATGVR